MKRVGCPKSGTMKTESGKAKSKSEKEKMLSGEYYDCGDKELITRWHLAKELTLKYNTTPTDDTQVQNQILDQLLGSRGFSMFLTPPFYCDYGENIHIGSGVEINANCVFLDCNRIDIGDNVLIAPSVQIYTVFHPVRASDRFYETMGDRNHFVYCRSQTEPVKIGNNVWIGGGSIILPGVTIGDNTTIGAGSVVTKSIPSDVLAVGNPCRVVRKL